MTDLSLLSRDELFKRIHELEHQLESQATARSQFDAPFSAQSFHEVSRRIAHDIKAPVRQISQLSQILTQSRNGVLDQNMLSVIDMITDRAAELDIRLEEVRAFSIAHFQPIYYEDLVVDDVVETCRLRARLTTDQVAVAGLEDLTLRGDQNLLDLLFHNLFAFLFWSGRLSPEVRLSLNVKELRSERSVLAILVRGYRYEMVGTLGLFEPFSSISVDGEPFGGGLKMSICATVCARHGWQLAHALGEEGELILTLQF